MWRCNLLLRINPLSRCVPVVSWRNLRCNPWCHLCYLLQSVKRNQLRCNPWTLWLLWCNPRYHFDAIRAIRCDAIRAIRCDAIRAIRGDEILYLRDVCVEQSTIGTSGSVGNYVPNCLSELLLELFSRTENISHYSVLPDFPDFPEVWTFQWSSNQVFPPMVTWHRTANLIGW